MFLRVITVLNVILSKIENNENQNIQKRKIFESNTWQISFGRRSSLLTERLGSNPESVKLTLVVIDSPPMQPCNELVQVAAIGSANSLHLTSTMTSIMKI